MASTVAFFQALSRPQRTPVPTLVSLVSPLGWPPPFGIIRFFFPNGPWYRPSGTSFYPRGMTIHRMDHVSVVVHDLAAAAEFFTELGMELEGEAPVEGRWVDRVNGLEDVRVDIAMMRTPDGHGRLELTRFRTPAAISAEPAPPNTLGIRSIMFAVDDIQDVLARLRAHGAELVGEVAQYEDSYLLCYVRGPAGIIVALAEQLN
jgi:catechol 2,3-dioxygenase-like lactoylglutathione lyase family enzyme